MCCYTFAHNYKYRLGVNMIIGVLNPKGGAGKSTIAWNFASVLATQHSANVLLVDADGQGSALDWAAARQTPALFSVVGLPRDSIHKEIKNVGRGYDFVLIDGPAGIEPNGAPSKITRSAILASDVIVIPTQPSPLDLWAMSGFIQTILDSQMANEKRRACFLVNRLIENSIIGRDFLEAVKEHPFPLLEKSIVSRVIFPMAAVAGKAAFEVEENGPGATEVAEALNNFLEKFVK